MTTSTSFHPFSFGLARLRLASHLPTVSASASPTAPAPAMSTPRTDWFDRLANWAERQPQVQHRLGSYLRLR